MFVSLGRLLLRRTPLHAWMKIRNNFTEVSGIIPVHVGVTTIRFWSLTVSCFFYNVRYTVAISVIMHVFTRNFTSAMSCKQSVCSLCSIISCSSMFNC